MLTELAEWGSLLDLADLLDFECAADEFNDLHARALVYTVLGGLSVLANRGLCHGDLRAQNVLVFEFQPTRLFCKLSDLEDASVFPRDNMNLFVAGLCDLFPKCADVFLGSMVFEGAGEACRPQRTAGL